MNPCERCGTRGGVTRHTDSDGRNVCPQCWLVLTLPPVPASEAAHAWAERLCARVLARAAGVRPCPICKGRGHMPSIHEFARVCPHCAGDGHDPLTTHGWLLLGSPAAPSPAETTR